MIGAEIRYLRDYVILLAGFLAVIGSGVAIAILGNLGPAGAVIICGFVIIAALFVAANAWLYVMRRRLRRGQPAIPTIGDPARPRARYVPIAINILAAIFFTYALGSAIWGSLHQLPHANDTLIILALNTIAWATFLVRRARNAPVFDTERLSQLQSAYAAPTRELRLRLSAPLRYRGLARLALLPLMFILIALLIPHLGIGLALVVAYAGVAGLFVILHKSVGL